MRCVYNLFSRSKVLPGIQREENIVAAQTHETLAAWLVGIVAFMTLSALFIIFVS